MYSHATYLIHYGIKGQKKGYRRFQNEDGSYTEEGKRRYGIGDGQETLSSHPEKGLKNKKSGPYEEHKHTDPLERIQQNRNKIKKELDRRRISQTNEMILSGREDKVSKRDKQKLKENLKEGYKNRMGGALSTAVAGWGLKNIGALVSVGLGHKVVGRIMQAAGHVMIGGSMFSAAANTGAYFIGKTMINQGKIKPEDDRGGKK